MRPWISRCNADCTHILGCTRCDVYYCFGRGVRPIDDDLVLTSALYVTNLRVTENGLCWCRCGILVGIRTSTHVVLIKYRTHWVRADSTHDSSGISDWVNCGNDVRNNFWACVNCHRCIGYGDDFASRLVDPLDMVNAVYCVDDSPVIRCLCGRYLGYQRGKDILLGEIAKVTAPAASHS